MHDLCRGWGGLTPVETNSCHLTAVEIPDHGDHEGLGSQSRWIS